MGFIYQNKNWLSKISLIAFSLFLSFNIASFSMAATQITGNLSPVDVGPTNAQISGVITNSKAELDSAAIKVRLGTGGIFTKESGFITPDAGGNIFVKINNLTPDTQYDFQIFDSAGHLDPYSVVVIENGQEVTKSIFSFKTSPPPAIDAVFETDSITEDGARIQGRIIYPPIPQTAEDKAKIKFKIEYGINPLNQPNKFEHKEADFLPTDYNGNFEYIVSGLETSTDYEYRIFDTEGVLAPSQIAGFKTAGQRQINASSFVSILGPNSVKIGGQILDADQRKLTLSIEYGLKDEVFGNYSAKTSPLVLDTAGNFFNVTLTGLQPGTTYQYRVTAGGAPIAVAPSSAGEFTTFDSSGGGGSSGSGIGNSNSLGAGETGTPPGAPSGNPSGLTGLDNPLKFDTLAGFIKSVLDIVLTIGIPIIAIFIIYSGFLFVKARGNPTELETAKATFLWTIVGAAILLASWILAMAICETVVKLGNTTTQCR